MLKRRRENEELKRGTLGLVQWGKNISDIHRTPGPSKLEKVVDPGSGPRGPLQGPPPKF